MSDWKDSVRKGLEERGYTPPERRSYELKLNNGKILGTVSYGAYNAIKNDSLDRYTPKDRDEEKILDKYIIYLNDQIQKQTQGRINSNPVFKRYNIDPDNFSMDDFAKWA